jgi:hypothetical protein
MEPHLADERPREVKLYFRSSEIAAIDEFQRTWTRIKSRNELFHVAMEFYLRMVKRNDGVVDGHGFPAVPISKPSDAPQKHSLRLIH